MLSSLVCAICFRSSHISAFTWRIVSCSVIVDLTCKKLNSDSSLVNSASVVTMLNLPDATSICSMGWKNTAMLLMCVVCAARLHSTMVSFSSRPATWFLSLPDTMAVPSAKEVVELVSTLIRPLYKLTSVSGHAPFEWSQT